MENEFIDRYAKWKARMKDMPPYSKSTAYTSLSEYQDFIALGLEAVPFLLQKLRENEGMDFLLADAIINIKGWDPTSFPQTDLEKRRLAVIEKLEDD